MVSWQLLFYLTGSSEFLMYSIKVGIYTGTCSSSHFCENSPYIAQIYNCKIYSKKTPNKSRTSQLFTFAYSWITVVWLQMINFLYIECDSSYMYCKEFYTFVSGKKTFKKELKLVLWYNGEINVQISLRWNTGFYFTFNSQYFTDISVIRGYRGRDWMVVGFTTTYAIVVHSNTGQVSSYWYNIMWYSLSVTCVR
jgi:hypothetical protein